MTIDFDEEIAGRPTDGDDPNWEPLEKLVGIEEAGDFIWIYEVKLDGGQLVNAYKHIVTDAYLFLAADGTAFDHLGGETYRRRPAKWMADMAVREPFEHRDPMVR